MSRAYYNEIDPFAAAWLRELIREGLIAQGDVDERSIAEVEPRDVQGYTQAHFFAGIGGWSYALRLAGWPDERAVWTGSCPCQPWSVAGSGEGTNDPRHLWPAWFRLIRESCPPVVFGEQTASTDGRYWLDIVYADLEARGYAIGAANLPAASVGAPHARARLWFVAHANGRKCDGFAGGEGCQPNRPQARWLESHSQSERNSQVSPLGNANGLRTERGARSEGRAQRTAPRGRQDEGSWGLQTVNAGPAVNLGNVRSVNEDGSRAIRIKGAAIGQADATRGFWFDCEWLWHRDGVYRAVEPGSFPLAARLPGDVDKIRAFGNAIVPQVAAEVIAAYMEIGR